MKNLLRLQDLSIEEINNILDLIEGDPVANQKFMSINEQCYFIEFKLVPNCNIHGAYIQPKTSEFVNPFVTKFSEPITNTIITPKTPEIIV